MSVRHTQRLVLVDASETRRAPVADALRGAGYQVTEVPTVAELVSRLVDEGGELELIALGDSITEEEAVALREQLLWAQDDGLS